MCMYRYRGVVNIVIFLVIVLLAFNVEHNPFKPVNVTSIANVSVSEDPLYKEIKNKSEQYKVEPQDAVIDRVWKKTPGRNGLRVNVNKSYEKMKEEGAFNESLLVYEQITPNVTLADLPPAPIYRGHPDKKMVSLLINVSWGTEHISPILEILKQNNVKATFFIEGKWAKQNAELVKIIAEEGHSIGNHAYNHPNMANMSNQDILDQISQTNEILKAITGKVPKWFAPPSGSFNDHVVDIAHNLQMETILWTVDTIDWKNPSVSVMMNRVMGKVHPGATILMHPTPPIEKGLDQLIKAIKNKGYKIGTIDKLISEER